MFVMNNNGTKIFVLKEVFISTETNDESTLIFCNSDNLIARYTNFRKALTAMNLLREAISNGEHYFRFPSSKDIE